MVACLDKYRYRVLASVKKDAHHTCVSKAPNFVGLDSAPHFVQQFIAENAIESTGDPLLIPHEDAARVTDYYVVGASRPQCEKLAWPSVAVCKMCIGEL